MSHDRENRRHAYRLLAEAHLNAARCLHVLGADVAAQATIAGERAADRVEDPVLAAIIRLQGCGVLMRRGGFDAVTAIAHESRMVVEQERYDTRTMSPSTASPPP